MEPAAQQRDEPDQDTVTPVALTVLQWSPPLSSGTNLGETTWSKFVAELQWSPPLSSGTNSGTRFPASSRTRLQWSPPLSSGTNTR